MSCIRIAAAGDIHCSEENRVAVAAAFDEAERDADLILLAGDLTTYGEPEQAALLAQICAEISTPVIAVLGNHDWHADRCAEITNLLEDAGVEMLNRTHTVRDVRGTRIGIVGTKGFIGGFPDSELPDFGEPILRRVYAETTAEVAALDAGLAAIADCRLRIVLMHYAPTTTTLVGERPVIWAFLGSSRMGVPIARYHPDLVLHGHAHGGTFEGSIDDIPVYNVAVPVLGRDFWIFELEGAEVKVEAEPAEPVAGPH
jgi:Icc-related predicted phosphoesterase